jgi:ribosome-associated protein
MMSETMITVINNKGRKISVPMSEIEFSAMRSEGPGGQHVNKTSSAVQLRFNITDSSLPQFVKTKLQSMSSHLITSHGEIIIKVSDDRSQLQNKETAIERFRELIKKAAFIPKKRKATKPTKSSIEKRINAKKIRGKVKKLRGKIDP